MSFLHPLRITTSLSRDFKATDVPHRFTLKIFTGGHNSPPDGKAIEKMEEFRTEQAYVSARILKRRFNFIPSFYEYTVEFQPKATEPPVRNLTPRVVRFGGDPTAESTEAYLDRGDWQAIEAFLRSQVDSQLRDWYVNTLAAEVGEYPQWLDEWVDKRPGEYLPLLFRGYFRVTWAWAARTGQRARNVTDEQFRGFHQRLDLAREDLDAAARLAPHDEAGAFAFMIPVAMGLQWDKATVMQIYQEAQRRRPWHQLVHASMIQALAPKWSGSLQAMMDLARSTTPAPTGSGALIAVPHAHTEAAAESDSKDYWREPQVVEEILTAAQRTIWAAGAYETPLTLNLHRAFLYCFIQMGEAEHALREFSAVDGRLGYPFTNMAEPAAAYKNAYVRFSARQATPSGSDAG